MGTTLINPVRVSTLGSDMRLIFVLLVFLPALIYGRPMDEDEPSNSNQDKEKVEEKKTDLPDSTEPGEGQEKEINEDEEQLGHKDCVDGSASCTMMMCDSCNSCWCKSKDGKRIRFAA